MNFFAIYESTKDTSIFWQNAVKLIRFVPRDIVVKREFWDDQHTQSIVIAETEKALLYLNAVTVFCSFWAAAVIYALCCYKKILVSFSLLE